MLPIPRKPCLSLALGGRFAWIRNILGQFNFGDNNRRSRNYLRAFYRRRRNQWNRLSDVHGRACRCHLYCPGYHLAERHDCSRSQSGGDYDGAHSSGR
jgi:hypothetical protein